MSDSPIGVGHGLPEEGAILNGNLVPHRYGPDRSGVPEYKAPLDTVASGKVDDALRRYERPTPTNSRRAAPKQSRIAASRGWT